MDAELQQALTDHKAGRLREAETAYRRIAALRPNQADVHRLLGVLTAQTNRLDEAYKCLALAEQLEPGNADVRSDLGRLAAMLGRPAEAETWLRQALAVAPNHLEALASLAKVLYQRQNLAEAQTCAETVLRAAPNRVDVLNVLALGLHAQNRLSAAEPVSARAISLAPNQAELHNTRGLILRDLQRIDEACAAFERALALQPKNLLPLYNLGICHYQRGAHGRALNCFSAVLDKQPGNHNARYALGETLIAQGRTAEGRRLLDLVIAANPRHWLVRWSRLLAFPIVYQSQAEIEETRADFARQLAALERDTLAHLATDLPNILRGAQYKTDFLLHYQGGHDLALQRQWGGLITQVAEAAYPAFAKPLEKRRLAPGEPIRLGFATSHLHNHSVAKTHGAWITDLPRERFAVSLFHLISQSDETTERLKRHAAYHACGMLSTAELIARIAAEQLDVLIWLDIGMEARAQIPSALRLAPIQATTWGHPVTSGLPAIDYYLSSDLMEPPEADSHYSETLVRLPNLSIAYPPPAADAGALPVRVSQLKAAGQTIFLCAQSLYKLLPEHDDVFPAIAQAVPDAAFVFISHRQDHATDLFSARLTRAFAAAGLSADNRITLLPRLSQADFFALNRAADVVLDSIGWAGCNSTLEALACDRPVVTLPGATMRARHGLAILGLIGLNGLIARDKTDYVAIATRLARDPAWRQTITETIAARKSALYGDRAPLDAFAAWLDSVARAES